MKKTIVIKVAELKAVALFAANNEARYYLNGVLVEANDTTTRLVATDGSILGLCNSRAENENVAFEEVIVPIHVVEQIVKMKGTNYGDVTVTHDGTKWEMCYSGLAVTFAPVEGKFPDYKRVIPDKVSGENAHFASVLLVSITKAQAVVNKKLCPLIWHSGDGSALFQLQGMDNFIGVVMPMRTNGRGEPKTTAPSTLWARTPLNEAVPA